MKRHCTCGHGKTLHEHHRRGTDCAVCNCAGFRRWRRPRNVVQTVILAAWLTNDLDLEYEELCADFPRA